MKWIKCSDRLPELEIEVLIWDGSIHLSCLYDYNKYYRDRARTRKDKYPPKIEWRTAYGDWYDEITHWMELPEAPSEQMD